MSWNRRARNRSDEPEGSWLLTYADMVTLLMAFFAMLFAFSSLDVQKFQALVSSLQGSLGVLDGGRSVHEDVGPHASSGLLDEMLGSAVEAQRLQNMYDTLLRFIEAEGLGHTVSVTMQEPGIVVRFPDQVLFDLGEADLKPEFQATLERFAEALLEWDGEIRVEGHSDSLPIHRPKFPSNWELSAARAATVVRFFVARGLAPERLSVAGYGEHRPIYSNATEEGRAKNRRVDVVLLTEAPYTAAGGLSLDAEESLPAN